MLNSDPEVGYRINSKNLLIGLTDKLKHQDSKLQNSAKSLIILMLVK